VCVFVRERVCVCERERVCVCVCVCVCHRNIKMSEALMIMYSFEFLHQVCRNVSAMEVNGCHQNESLIKTSQ